MDVSLSLSLPPSFPPLPPPLSLSLSLAHLPALPLLCLAAALLTHTASRHAS